MELASYTENSDNAMLRVTLYHHTKIKAAAIAKYSVLIYFSLKYHVEASLIK